MSQQIEVKQLSPAIQKALATVNYHAKDIEVKPTERVGGTVGGGSGQRGFVIIVNLDTGKFEGVQGSWGGGSPLSSSPVDAYGGMIDIPANGAVIKGTTGYPRTFAWIYAHPTAVGAHLLPSGNEDAEVLTDAEQQALYCFGSIKGGEYRRDEMRRRNVTAETVDSLVERGYLKRNRAGATQITTKGKNARTIRH